MEIPHPKFQIFKGKDDQFYFRLKSVNGNILVSSEAYTQKDSALNGIRSVKENGTDEGNYRKKTSDSGDKHSFSIIAKNGQVVATSQSYESESGRDNGVQSTMNTAPDAAVEDTTTGFEAHKNPKFQIYEDKAGEYRFRLYASNGEIILASEGYSSKAGAKGGIDSAQAASKDDENFDKLTAKNGEFYFNLKSANGSIVGTSEMFSSEASRDNSAASVKQTASGAPTEDYTLYPLVELDKK
ncbi:MAG: DUF1508 domain-containing protein [Bacteroidota bacterium]